MRVNFITQNIIKVSTLNRKVEEKNTKQNINKNFYNNYISYNNVSFSAKPFKIIPSPEEIARRKALELQSINQRHSLPAILQMLFPLPVSSGIKAKHVQEINKRILADEYLSKFSSFKTTLNNFILGNISEDLSKKEDDALNAILYSDTNPNEIFVKDLPFALLLDKAFINLENFKNIPIKDKALILSILKSFGTDAGELAKNKDSDFNNLIQYAKDVREKLTEPVEAVLTEEEIENYFKQNKTESLIALLTVGGHPSRQRLEQRINKFDKSLRTINYLFQIPDLRNNLVNICKNQNKVNPAEIIKFLELSKGMLDLGTSIPELNILINNSILKEGINIDYLSSEYLKKLISTYTTNPNIDFSNWDLGNVYTIPYFLKKNSETHKERLKDLILSSVNNNYQELIHTSSSTYGQGNLLTKSLFETNGLNYDTWLNYDKEISFKLLSQNEYSKKHKNYSPDSKFPKQNEDFAIRIWRRDPTKDLFQGSTAGQCIALDGINGYAGVDELLYSYAQLIEIVNKHKDKSIGNACAYWIQDKNEELALLIDSIGIHTEYENNPQIRNQIFAFAKEYANTVAGKPVKIYIGNQFNKLDIQDLAKQFKDDFKIIGNTNGNKSYLDAIIAKDRFERYTVIDNNRTYLMELREIK